MRHSSCTDKLISDGVKARCHRSQKGSSLAEVAVGAMVMTVMLIFSLDICMAMMLYGVNDRACRDAARAAARASKPEDAENLAKAALKSFTGGGFLVQPEFGSPTGVS